MAKSEPIARTADVSFRVRRTTTEYTFVGVPVNGEVMIEQPDGTGRLDVKKMTQLAIEMARAADTKWYEEDRRIEIHPIQTPRPTT